MFWPKNLEKRNIHHFELTSKLSFNIFERENNLGYLFIAPCYFKANEIKYILKQNVSRNKTVKNVLIFMAKEIIFKQSIFFLIFMCNLERNYRLNMN